MDVFLTGVSKKLLIATCIVVVIVEMCLTPAEAASLMHKKHRSQLENMSKRTKEMLEMPSEAHLRHRGRHQRHPHHQHIAKDRPNDLYKKKMDKVIRKLLNTIRDFSEHRYKVNESEEYRNPSIKVPITNFVQIRFHNYSADYNGGSSLVERKFTYRMPRLYRSIAKYNELFKVLQKVKVVSPDVVFSRYYVRRQEFLKETTKNLQGTMAVIRDALKAFRMPVPNVNRTRINLNDFKTEVNASECLQYDIAVIRGYGSHLYNWYCLLTNHEDREKRMNTRCAKFERKLREKKQQRKHRNRKRIAAF